MDGLCIQNFKLGCRLGEGLFGTIHLAHHKSDETAPYAIKMMPKKYIIRNKWTRYVQNERNMLLKLQGSDTTKFTVKLHASFMDDSNLYFLFELAVCDLSSLISKIRDQLASNKKSSAIELNFLNKVASSYCKQILNALEYIHFECNIVHFDLKPENILVFEGGSKLKLADFAFARYWTNHNSGDESILCYENTDYRVVGTEGYVAPELSSGDIKERLLNAIDLWAFGCIIRDFFRINYNHEVSNASECISGLLNESPADRVGVLDQGFYNSLRRYSFFSETKDEYITFEIQELSLRSFIDGAEEDWELQLEGM